MRRILTIFVSLHWAMAFGTLSVLSIMAFGHQEPRPALAIFGLAMPAVGSGGAHEAISALLTVAMASLAAFFVWVFLTALNHEETTSGLDEAARMAFGASIGFLSLVTMGTLAFAPGQGDLTAISIQLGALLISYLAVFAETSPRSDEVEAETPDELEDRIRRMALEAGTLASHHLHTARVYPFPGKDR